jgi:hypothetical protein
MFDHCCCDALPRLLHRFVGPIAPTTRRPLGWAVVPGAEHQETELVTWVVKRLLGEAGVTDVLELARDVAALA